VTRLRPALSGPRLAVPAAIVVAIVGFVILSAVAGSPSSSGHAAGGAKTPAVKLAANKLGRILVDAHGRTLYMFLEDGATSSCYGGCARVWPAALVAGTPVPGPGVIAHKLTTAPRRHARLRQLVYNGHPLYTTAADAKPGETDGQGVFNTWWVISAAGKQIGKPSKDAGGY
jgi:predicted lipoprotein with Yx(FWY)xxD motif